MQDRYAGDIEDYGKEDKTEVCRLCGKGIMLPMNPDASVNHCFVCIYCGEHLNISPADVAVE